MMTPEVTRSEIGEWLDLPNPMWQRFDFDVSSRTLLYVATAVGVVLLAIGPFGIRIAGALITLGAPLALWLLPRFGVDPDDTQPGYQPARRVRPSELGLEVGYGRITRLDWWELERLEPVDEQGRHHVRWRGGTFWLNPARREEARVLAVIERLLKLRAKGYRLPSEPDEVYAARCPTIEVAQEVDAAV